METDRPVDQERTATVPYDLAMLAFFDLMLASEVLPGTAVQCTECLADDTIPEDEKYKLHKNASDLKRHVQSNVHSPYRRWIRKATIAKDQDADNKFRCIPACGKTYDAVKQFQKHLENVTKKMVDNSDTSEMHYDMLHQEGWLSTMFKKSRRDKDQSQQINATRQKWRQNQYGHLPQLTELTRARPAVVNGAPSQHVSVGPSQPDISMLEYPTSLQRDENSAMILYGDCANRGLLGTFAAFGSDGDGDDDQPLLAAVLRKRGMSDDEIFGDRGKLPKF